MFPPGAIFDNDLSTIHPVSHEDITEYVTHSWFSYNDENQGLHPWDGQTNPNFTGPQPPYDYLETDNKYSWLKAPRFQDRPMEVGPLARVLVAYASGDAAVKQVVDSVLGQLGAGPEALFSTLGRTAARAIETIFFADKLLEWTDELIANIAKGDLAIHEQEHWDPATWPAEAKGFGFHEAPRGSLGHWIHIKDKKIENYQAVVPSTWNASPRDAKGNRGPYEESLIGTPIADPDKPLEVLRTIHSFDPCLACAVHLLDSTGREINQVVVR
jgi:Ni,Fe-hydrogenase I large subunit